MYENVAARIPESIVKDINYVAQEENSDKSKVIRELLSSAVKDKLTDLALEKYSKREVSLGRAAELAKMPLADFMMKAAERKIPINYSVDSLEKDFKAAVKAK
jgi:predicted HTH domain antitoxin